MGESLFEFPFQCAVSQRFSQSPFLGAIISQPVVSKRRSELASRVTFELGVVVVRDSTVGRASN